MTLTAVPSIELRRQAAAHRADLEALIFDGYRPRPCSPRWSRLLDGAIVLQELLDEMERLHEREAA